jgi:3-phenylpropionate/trans-cinnamate dioxygenase ferredoxin subunit
MGTEVRVCSTTDVPAPSSRRFDLDGHRLCIVHLDDDWYAIGDRCSHADWSLSEGDLWVEEREIECPKHGSTFDLRTGEPLALPATKPVPVYEVRVEGDDVLVTLP